MLQNSKKLSAYFGRPSYLPKDKNPSVAGSKNPSLLARKTAHSAVLRANPGVWGRSPRGIQGRGPWSGAGGEAPRKIFGKNA